MPANLVVRENGEIKIAEEFPFDQKVARTVHSVYSVAQGTGKVQLWNPGLTHGIMENGKTVYPETNTTGHTLTPPEASKQARYYQNMYDAIYAAGPQAFNADQQALALKQLEKICKNNGYPDPAAKYAPSPVPQAAKTPQAVPARTGVRSTFSDEPRVSFNKNHDGTAQVNIENASGRMLAHLSDVGVYEHDYKHNPKGGINVTIPIKNKADAGNVNKFLHDARPLNEKGAPGKEVTDKVKDVMRQITEWASSLVSRSKQRP